MEYASAPLWQQQIDVRNEFSHRTYVNMTAAEAPETQLVSSALPIFMIAANRQAANVLPAFFIAFHPGAFICWCIYI